MRGRWVALVLTGALLASACGNKPQTMPAPLSTSRTRTPVAAGNGQTDPGAAAPAGAAVASPSPAPTAPRSDAPMARLEIPKIRVNAKFVTLGIIAATNTMDSPKNKDDVGYYDFSPRPGYGGNTVLSGHVDWFTGETGVFWDLKKLVVGDELAIVLADDTSYRYRVSETQLYDGQSAPVEDIIGPTAAEAVTLITCEGVFNRSAAEYDKRRVVRAMRVS